MSYAEIARVMQISPKTVEIQIGNALKRLREALADWM
jgi:DNA-directed RNA polymerase specialized sigma24 family protein